MTLSTKVKSLWNNTIKPVVTNPWSYATLAAFSLGGFAKAQSTEIKQESKLEKTTGEYNIHGTIRGTNAQGLEGIEVKRIMYNDNWPLEADTSTTYTNSLGEFNTTYTGIEDIVQIENIGEIKYQIINTPTIQLNLNKLSKVEMKIYTILGQEIKTLLDEETNNKTINTDINNLASGVYILQTIIDGKPYTNKILKTENKYNYGKNKQEVTKETRNKSLEKTTDETYLYYGFQINDPNGQHYTHQFQMWNGWYLDATDISHSVPLLEKKNLDITFTNTRTGQPVENTKDFLFYVLGIDVLGHASQLPIEKPWRVYLDRANIPLTYSEQEVTNSTLEMITSVGLPVDTTFYKEVQTRTPIGDNGTSYINYRFLPTSDPEMGDYDLVISYIVNAQKSTASLEFKFNTDRIEPEHIGDFVKHAWWGGVVMSTNISPTAPGYFSYDPRDSIRNMTRDENEIFTFLSLIEKREWIGPETITDESTNMSITQPPIFTQPTSYQIKIKGKDIKIYHDMRRELEQKETRYK